MANVPTRRTFLKMTTATGALSAFGLGGPLWAAPAPADDVDRPVADTFPSQDPAAVREVVGAAHTRFERVQELVTARPALALATWDWGFGDWETALGAASHMGRRDIAALLLEHGARPDIFTYAMLGDLAAVRSAVEATPGVQRTAGPHGITLLQHARNGIRRDDTSPEDRRRGEALIEYLEGLGDADPSPKSLPVTEEEKQAYLGRYTFGSGEEDVLVVDLDRRGNLALRRGERVHRVLHRIEGDTFAPSGAHAVRIRFERDREDANPVAVSIHDPDLLVRALRGE